MNTEHCEQCGEFLHSDERVYCTECLDADRQKNGDESGVVKISKSDLNIAKWLLALTKGTE